MRVTGRLGLGLTVTLVAVSLGAAFFRGAEPVGSEVPPSPRTDTPSDEDRLRADPGVRAFVESYGSLIDSVAYRDEDATFYLGSEPVRFMGGRMVMERRAEGEAETDFQPIFYRYSLEPLAAPPAPTGEPVYSTDVLVSLFGRTEGQIRRHARSATFLDHKIFVNTLLLEPLEAVERDVREAARRDAAVAAWIDHLDVVYSFASRSIAGSGNRSYHAWGMAVDLRPDSYGGRHVYWRWSRARDREGWSRIPLAKRWAPPQAVVEAFERHGFVWGGKWYHFDVIHFEYRPEIILFNRLLAEEDAHPAPPGS
jgi:hypothetical protein